MIAFTQNGKSSVLIQKFHYWMYLGFLLLVVAFFFIFIDSQNAKAAPPQVVITDSAPYYVNQSSDPVCVLELNMTDDDSAVLQIMNITVENITAFFDPNTDLAPLFGITRAG